MTLRMLALCALCAMGRARSLDELLEQAEDEEAMRAVPDSVRRATAEASVTAALGAMGRVTLSDDEWALGLTELQFSEDGVDDEVLPYITGSATEAELKPAPAASGMAVLHRKQRFAGLQVTVLENQLVVLSGTESKAEREERERLGLGLENALASRLARTPIYGTAMFLLAHRRPVDGAPHRHELAFFDRSLWHDFVEYMRRAREAAIVFGGPLPWTTQIHWNVLPKEQRAPWVLASAEASVVATPALLPPPPNIA